MDFQGSKTEQNIKAAFTSEAIARCRYAAFAQGAREEGREDIAELFEKMSENEKEHAKLWYRIFHSGYGKCDSNLENAADKEGVEWKTMYPKFAKAAHEEGFDEIAVLFERIASIEYDHERRFTEALLQLSNGKEGEKIVIGKSDEKYYCTFCGNVSETPLDLCPVCGAHDAYTD